MKLKSHLLVLIRHGQSEYNLKNQFTGSADCDLSDLGREEASVVGQELKEYGFEFDEVYCSALKRTFETYKIIAQTMQNGFEKLPVHQVAALNERNYGLLQGKNKDEAIEKYGAEQVETWRRGFYALPPDGESLEQTEKRVVDFYNAVLVPALQSGKRLLLIAHGNSLRSLVMHLENISPHNIESLNIVTGEIIVYELDERLKIIRKEIKNPIAKA